jgi:hypothetical protein
VVKINADARIQQTYPNVAKNSSRLLVYSVLIAMDSGREDLH